jgi:hypothetical protein
MMPHGSESAALEALEAEGFTGRFIVVAGSLRLAGGGRAFSPDELTIHDYQRFEGVSDPDDMSIVYAIESSDGTKGTLVDAFGVYASPVVAQVMERVGIQRKKPPTGRRESFTGPARRKGPWIEFLRPTACQGLTAFDAVVTL